MNRTFSSVWSEITRTYVAVAENVRRRGKASRGSVDETTAAPGGEIARSGLLRPRPMPLALEVRFMFDGAGVVAVGDIVHTLEPTAQPDTSAHAEALARPAELAPAAVSTEAPAREATPPAVTVREVDPAQNGGRKEVAFIDTAVADYQTLVDGVRAGVEVVLIDSSQSGLAQMAEWATRHSGYDAIHVLSHGTEGTLQLGRDTVTQASLANASAQAELAQLGQALTQEGDLLLYGCLVAAGESGQAFVSNLATLTGADVAASRDITGTAQQGGNWELENVSGILESRITVNADILRDYSSTFLPPPAPP